MGPVIRQVDNPTTRHDFIRLPYSVHAGHSNWLPPLISDELNFFNPERNPAFSQCETVMAVAYNGTKPRGRIMGIIHPLYNQQHNEKTARFCFFDCYNEPDVAAALLGFIENWAREKGMTSLTGPFGFSDKDPQGFQVEGFGTTPLLDTNCNLPYMNEFMIQNGYGKLMDCLTYRFETDLALPEIYTSVDQRVRNNQRYNLIEFKNTRELAPYIIPVMKLTNETYNQLYGFNPMSEKEMQELARRYMPVLNPAYIKVITFNGALIAYLIGIPNMSAGLKKAGGKLLPIGWFHIMRSMKKAGQLDLMLGAVRPDFQGHGLEIRMGLRLMASARRAGMRTIETHLILETNKRMRAVTERLNIPVEKRFRIYTKNAELYPGKPPANKF